MTLLFVMDIVPVGCATCRFSFEFLGDALVARQSLFCVDGCVSEFFDLILSVFFFFGFLQHLFPPYVYVSVLITIFFCCLLLSPLFSILKTHIV